MLLCTFFWPLLHDYAVEMLISRFMQEVNKRRRIFLFLSQLECDPPRNQIQGKSRTLDIFSKME